MEIEEWVGGFLDIIRDSGIRDIDRVIEVLNGIVIYWRGEYGYTQVMVYQDGTGLITSYDRETRSIVGMAIIWNGVEATTYEQCIEFVSKFL